MFWSMLIFCNRRPLYEVKAAYAKNSFTMNSAVNKDIFYVMFSIIRKTVSQHVPEDRCIKQKLFIYDLSAVNMSYAKNSCAINTVVNKDIFVSCLPS